jgi:hypothetical protein
MAVELHHRLQLGVAQHAVSRMAVVVGSPTASGGRGATASSAASSFDQVVPDLAAQVRQVEAAEEAVPVGVVGLGAVEVVGERRAAPLGRQRGQASDRASMRLCIQLASG